MGMGGLEDDIEVIKVNVLKTSFVEVRWYNICLSRKEILNRP